MPNSSHARGQIDIYTELLAILGAFRLATPVAAAEIYAPGLVTK
jgi:hypothetical protein